MKRNLKIFASIASTLLIATPTVAILTSCSPTTTVTPPTQGDGFNKPMNFVDNTNIYKNQFVENNKTVLDAKQFNLKEFNILPSDPNSQIYITKIFNRINKEIIKNDLMDFLSNLSNQYFNTGFKANISDYQINFDENNKQWNIKISFEIYNGNNISSFYLFNNNHNKIALTPYEKISSKLNIIGNINYEFLNSQKRLLDYNTVFAGYSFDNATWVFGNQEYKINNFKFSDYSKTLNTEITGIINKNIKSYVDIKEFAEDKLKQMNLSQFENELTNTVDTYINKGKDIIGPTQSLLQNLLTSHTQNESAKIFLNNNAELIASLAQSIINNINSNITVENLIVSILKDKTLYQILKEQPTVDEINKILGMISPDISSTIIQFIEGIGDQESFNQMLDKIKELVLSLDQKLYEQISTLIDEFKVSGVLTAIIKNKNIVLELLNNFGIVDNELNALLSPFLNVILDIDNKTMITILFDLLKSQNEGGLIYLKEIIKLFNFIPANISGILDQVVFNNPNFTIENFVSFIDTIANPKKSSNSNEVVRYDEWINSIQKEIVFDKNNSYNPSDLTLNLNYSYKITFTNDIYFSIKNLSKILPNSLTINNSNIPLSTIKSILPSWISVNANDYIKYSMNANDQVVYDILNKNNNNVLSWKMPINSIVDINMPQTIKTLYDSSKSLTGDAIINVSKTIFFHKYEKFDFFKPLTSLLNSNVIENYSYNIKTNEALFTKDIMPERKLEIINEIKNNTTNEDILVDQQPIKYTIAPSTWFSKEKVVHKTETKTNIDYNKYFSEFINIEYLKSKVWMSFNNNILIDKFSVVGLINIDTVKVTNISIYTPYSMYTNNNIYRSTWVFNL